MNPELLTSCIDDQVFREATLRQVVVLARQRRRAIYLRKGFTAACILVVALLALHIASPSSRPVAGTQNDQSPGMAILRKPAAQRVRTEARLFAKVTPSSGGFARVQSTPELFVPIATESSAPKVNILSDRQLLAAFPRHPALIAPGTERARLVFYQ